MLVYEHGGGAVLSLKTAISEPNFSARIAALTSKGQKRLASQPVNCSQSQEVKKTAPWPLTCMLMDEFRTGAEESSLFVDFTHRHKASGSRNSRGQVHCLSTGARASRLKPDARTSNDEGLAAFLVGILESLFGCRHAHLSRVFTLGGETYRVCFDCAGKFEYSMETMSIQRRLPPAPVVTRFRIA